MKTVDMPIGQIPIFLKREAIKYQRNMNGYCVDINNYAFNYCGSRQEPHTDCTRVYFDIHPMHPLYGSDICIIISRLELIQQADTEEVIMSSLEQAMLEGYEEAQVQFNVERYHRSFPSYKNEPEPLPEVPDTKGPTCRRCSKPNLQEFMTSQRDASTVCKKCFTIMKSAGVGFEKESE